MVAATYRSLTALLPSGVICSTTLSTRPSLFAIASITQKTRSPATARSTFSTTMFRKALDCHNANAPKTAPSLKSQLFPSSSPVAPRDAFAQFKPPSMVKPRPLSNSSGNVSKNVTSGKSNGHNNVYKPAGSISRGIKRTSSGLAKALDNSFDGFNTDLLSSQDDVIIVDDALERNQTSVYFDENDFDSDIELDVEDPSSKGTIACSKSPPAPSLPAKTVNSLERPPRSGTGQNHAPQLLDSTSLGHFSSSSTADNSNNNRKSLELKATKPMAQSTTITGFVNQGVTSHEPRLGSFNPRTRMNDKTSSCDQIPASSTELPWSSSPEDYRSSSFTDNVRQPIPNLREFMHTAELPQAVEAQRPAKRRQLPWAKPSAVTQNSSKTSTETNEMTKDASNSTTTSKNRPSNSAALSTPAAKKADSLYPWNTTASAVKEQQKALRQTTKKLVKTNDATQEDIKTAVARKKRTTVSRVFLSEEQQQVLNLVVEQKNSVFFTGSAGTGKSVLLREIISSLRRKFQREPDRVAVTASTGLAACNIGGVTLHSFAGIGLGKDSTEELVKKIKKNQKAKHRWMRTKVLIVDEVSMVDGELFDKLEAVARMIRNNGRPFGGIQLVITGDFFQLPPVPDRGKVAKFAFDAATWNTTIEHTIALHHVFRQKDPVFANMLNEMREGRLTGESIAAFKRLQRPLHFDDAMDATELFPTRDEVERANRLRMQQLPGSVLTFHARDGGSMTDLNMRAKLLQNCMAPDRIELKVGSQVMLIKNIDETLVNGSLGRVVNFMSEATFDTYTENEDAFHELANAAEEDLNPVQRKLKAKLDNQLGSTAHLYPLVRFAISDGTTRDLLCQRESWKVELPNGEVQASRSQVPLILAWAISIHKAQGQTLERVKVDLGKVFEKGQAYVALSRATSMEGLQVMRFDPKKVIAHPRVGNFYRGLSRAEAIVAGGKGKSTTVVSQKLARNKSTESKMSDYERYFLEGGADGM